MRQHLLFDDTGEGRGGQNDVHSLSAREMERGGGGYSVCRALKNPRGAKRVCVAELRAQAGRVSGEGGGTRGVVALQRDVGRKCARRAGGAAPAEKRRRGSCGGGADGGFYLALFKLSLKAKRFISREAFGICKIEILLTQDKNKITTKKKLII
jgi:hypothetical protein